MSKNLAASHASNVANFNTLISCAKGFGVLFNPSQDTIKIDAMQILYEEGRNVLRAANVVQADYKNATTARNTAFKPLNKLTTRVMNAFKVNVHNDQSRAQLRSLIRILQGIKLKPKKSTEVTTDPTTEDRENVSHKSDYDSRLETFDSIIQFLKTFTAYIPNETELSIAGLTAYYNDLAEKNAQYNETETAKKNIRIVRDTVLYTPVTGLGYVGLDGKSYIRSVFGPRSLQFKQVAKLKFIIHKI
jgi:hypothetical protein